jgi:hypothetical protein
MSIPKIAGIIFTFTVVTLAEPSKHWFRPAGTLTEADSRPAYEIGVDLLRAAATELGLGPADLAGVYVWKEYRTAHNGVTHLVYRQRYHGIDVHNAEWVVNIDRDGRVINAGGNLFVAPGADVSPPAFVSSRTAVLSAINAVNPKLAEGYTPFESAPSDGKRVAYRWTGGSQIEGRLVWFAVNGVLRPAWAFTIVDGDGINAYETVVDDGSQRILLKDSLTFFQNARGLVFTGSSPQPNPSPGVQLQAPPPIVNRTMVPFTGDSAASPRGWVTGNETVGNNAIAGWNPTGLRFLQSPETAKSVNGEFNYPLEVGRDAPNPINFTGAATVNLFYWVNRAHDFFHQIGFDEAAGNFQQDNFQRGGQGGDPLYAYTQFGHAATGAASLSNAFFTTRGVADGSTSMIAMFLGSFGGYFSDGSFDAEVIIHEYAHGVTNRLLRGYGSFQTAAMGEAWSDFYSLEFTVPEGAPVDGVYPQGEYLFQGFGTGIRTRPYSTRMEVNPLTFAHLGHVTLFPEVHADGEIWGQVLWELRAALIAQFGEREGRRRARLIVLDALKLSPPAPSFIDMRDAILMADRVGFRGESQDTLWAAFARRGLGVLAQSSSGNTVHVLPSYERPSTTGSLRFYEPQYTIGETVRVVLHDSNLSGDVAFVHFTGSSGDAERILLRRRGEVFLGSIPSLAETSVTKGDGALSLINGDFISAYYSDADAGGSTRLIEVTVPARPGYTQTQVAPGFRFTGETRMNFRSGFNTFRRFELPFSFPYYGRRYSSLRVFSNGLLSFDLPVSTLCTDSSALTRHTAIAPLWMELRTNGFAQPNEDVYVSEAPDSITFRWAAETDSVLPNQVPQPVNFATTLFQDGRIQFHYGSGNQNLTNGLAFSGCPTSTPTVGISPGTETYSQTVFTLQGQADLEEAPGVIFIPAFEHRSNPEAVLESPVDGDTAQGLLRLRGIAYDREAFVTRLDVLIDGVWRARTVVNTSRTDFCAQERVPGCPLVGFNANLDLVALGIAPGTHTVQLRATNSMGGFFTFPEKPVTIQVAEGQSRAPFGAIESPEAGAEVKDFVTIRGYAAATDLRVLAVDVLIDGITYGRATYGLPRADICNTLDPRPLNCQLIGFMMSLNTRAGVPLANGPHSLQIRVLDETGRLTVIPETPVPITVNNDSNVPPTGRLIAPTHNERVSGIIAIYGHAWDPDGRVTQVQLLVNGEVRATIPYGRPRPEECEALSDVTACPNIGFETGFDTRRLNNGPNVLGVRLVDDRGTSVVIPSQVRDGINLMVEN